VASRSLAAVPTSVTTVELMKNRSKGAARHASEKFCQCSSDGSHTRGHR
jgi:hypothetical protein